MHTNEPSSAGNKRFQTKLQFTLTTLQNSKRNDSRQNISALYCYRLLLTWAKAKKKLESSSKRQIISLSSTALRLDSYQIARNVKTAYAPIRYSCLMGYVILI